MKFLRNLSRRNHFEMSLHEKNFEHKLKSRFYISGNSTDSLGNRSRASPAHLIHPETSGGIIAWIMTNDFA